MLRILLLGTPVVFLDDRPIQIQRKLQRVLLYYLACQPLSVSRAELALVFWPDAENDEVARRRLREALSKLRAELPNPGLILADNQSVSLDSQQVWVDALELQHSLRRVWSRIRLIPTNTPLPDAMGSELQKMVDLWRGDHFMAGVNLPKSDALDRWMAVQTRELDYIRQQMLERLGYHMAASGNPEGGIYYLRQVLKNDELNETLHLQVLTWLENAGKHSDALSYCEYLKTIFIEEQGQSLPPGLERFAQKIQAGGRASAPAPAQTWPIFPDLHIPFVGRAELLKSLRQAFHRGGTVMINGETGAGKTRLVRQLFLSLQPGPRLLLAPAHSAGRNLPFQPIIDMLRNTVSREEWRDLPEIWAAPLAWILPDLLALRPELQASIQNQEAARSRIFEALRQLLLALSRQQRVLFFLDDAQWCDQATFSALAYLQNQQFFGKYGLLALAARVEEPSPDLREFLDNIQRQTMVVSYQLPELGSQDVHDLYRSVLGQDPSPLLVARLARDTGGNPLLLVETLRALLDAMPNPAVIGTLEEIPIASSITSLVRARLRSLSLRSRQMLEAAAVCGGSFTPGLLEIVLHATPEQTAAELDELEHRHLIRPDRPAESSSYHFVHDVFREVLLRELTPARRRLLHMRVAQALESLGGFNMEGSGALLAEHYQAAGQPAHACQFWVQAAEYARRLFSPAEALAAYRRAESLLPGDQNEISEACVLRIYTGLAEIAYESADLHEMKNAYTRLQHAGEQRGSAILLGSAFSGQAQTLLLKGDLEPALERVDDALRVLAMTGNRQEQMRAHFYRGSILQVLLRIHEAAGAYERVIELGHGVFDPAANKITARALDRLSMLSNAAGWPRKSLAYSEHSLRHHRVEVSGGDATETHGAQAAAYYWLGEYALALQTSRQGLEQARLNRKWRFAGQLHMTAARACLALGRLDECWGHIERLSENSRHFGFIDLLGDGLCVWGDLLGVLQNLPGAALAYQAAADEAGNNSYISLYARFNLGLIAGLRGEVESGLRMVDAVIEFTGERDFARVQLPARVSRAILLAKKGERVAARAELGVIVEEARRREMATSEMVALMQLAQLDLLEGQPAAALGWAEATLAGARRAGHRFHELTGLRLGAQALRAQGGDPAEWLERARAILEEMDRGAQDEHARPHFEAFRARQLEILFD